MNFNYPNSSLNQHLGRIEYHGHVTSPLASFRIRLYYDKSAASRRAPRLRWVEPLIFHQLGIVGWTVSSESREKYQRMTIFEYGKKLDLQWKTSTNAVIFRDVRKRTVSFKSSCAASHPNSITCHWYLSPKSNIHYGIRSRDHNS